MKGLKGQALSFFLLLKSFSQHRQEREQIAAQPKFRILEYRRFGIAVDGDDRLARLHTGQMLHRTGDANGDVKLWRNGLSRQPNLRGIRPPSTIDGFTARADGTAQHIRKLLGENDVLAFLEAAADGGVGRCRRREP